ncbi:carbonic anhydrase family protein [uncultured Dokdonia sp.]|uniref:carbonic anhydrase family protein n=1 Tax=uncultured Dokdonia sp. TaxID=575653 RepID=UPI00261B4D36|nr:carbonic anhydrase family protein [uncultured Dokdonia sp.]
MKALNKDTQAAITPADSLQRLKDGNARFTSTSQAQRNLLEQVSDTSGGQWPHAVVLSCIDSRVPVETIFDQGIGDIFSARVAGNVVSPHITASIEYGCKVAGSRVVVILGHTGCGAVKTAIQDANAVSPLQLGSIRSLLDNIKPSVHAVQTPDTISERTYENKEFFDAVVYKNVALTIENLKNDSPVLKEMEENKEIKIVGAVYSVGDGKVTFMD